MPAVAQAEALRVATFNADLTRRGPGLLLRDILTGSDPQIEAAAKVIAVSRPDVVVLTGVDFDNGLVALSAFAERVAAAGHPLPHRFAFMPNTGMQSGIDLDGDGVDGGPGDAQGFGRFAGEGGMAILSRFPVDTAGARNFSGLLWRDMPGASLPQLGGAPYPSEAAQAVQRLSTTGHWDVPITLGDGTPLHLLAWLATPPVFDGPEDRNGLRNHDEAAFWLAYLDGRLPWAPPTGRFVLLGDANLDPVDGDGLPVAIKALLDDPRLQDPRPASPGAAEAADAGHHGPAAQDTADFGAAGGPGRLRVDYVLPDARLRVTGAGVVWPASGDPMAQTVATASRHRLVWVDIETGD